MKAVLGFFVALQLLALPAHAKDVLGEIKSTMAAKRRVPVRSVDSISKVYRRLLSNGRYYMVADYYVEFADHKCFKVVYHLGTEHALGFVVDYSPTRCY